MSKEVSEKLQIKIDNITIYACFPDTLKEEHVNKRKAYRFAHIGNTN